MKLKIISCSLAAILLLMVICGEAQQQEEITGEIKKVSIPLDWPEGLWQISWNGKWVDFTIPEWERLSHELQLTYAVSYQVWYGSKCGLPIEKEFHAGKVSFVLCLIPPGRFWMGSPEGEKGRNYNEEKHRVLISKPFWMQKTEITQEQWYQVTGKKTWEDKLFAMDNPQHAVNYISWKDIKEEFLPPLESDLDLPTEAQWEYACRSGTLTRFYWGDDENYTAIGEYAWYEDNAADNGENYPHAVGQRKPNAWGLYDMSGNVDEWCRDSCDCGEYLDAVTDTYRDNIEDPLCMNGSSRISRGGSYFDSAKTCRLAYRSRLYYSCQHYSLGGRVCLPIKDQ